MQSESLRTLTENQLEVMAHTIGLSNAEERNWFGAGKEGQDREDLDFLEFIGLVRGQTPPLWMGDDRIFKLTPKGISIVLEHYKRK